MGTTKKAVILLSGGIDSATALAIARSEGFELYALSFRYGQRHRQEIVSAEKIARLMEVKEHRIISIDPAAFDGSPLTGKGEIPHGRKLTEIQGAIAPTYVPARNTIFLSFALGWAEVVGAQDIFIGAHIVDYSGYPDCRPEYFKAFEKMARLATRVGIEGKEFRIRTPLSQMGKAAIIKRGMELGIDFLLTHSCYDPLPDGKACGRCDSCILRLKGFRDAGLDDPIPYG